MMTMAVAACTLWAAAVPARRVRTEVTQPDGSHLAVTLCGDEWQHYYLTDDGQPLMRGADGCLYHAVTDALGRLKASSVMAHEKTGRGVGEWTFLQLRGDVRPQRTAVWSGEDGQPVTMGKKRGVVILAQYADVKFARADVRDLYERLLNGEGAPEYGMEASVNRYFLDQSNDQFDLTFDVLGPVTLSNTMAYYGANDAYGNDCRPTQMVREAVRLASPEVDYSDYDWDGNGEVEQVFVLYAGYAESSGASADAIWPHAWQLSAMGAALTLDGVRIDRYACACDLRAESGTLPNGIGTFCHEFSHCLGLADAYHTGGGQVYGMDQWSLMDYGCYLGGDMWGDTPCNYTAFERWSCGWSTPVELTAPRTVTGMASLSDWGKTYVIYNGAFPKEFYMLENRQPTGWDRYLSGHGMLVTHIDYNMKAWADNVVNNTAGHPRYTILAADNSMVATPESVVGDPYPGISGNTSLTDTSTPAATLFNVAPDGRKLMGKPIERIAESADGLISFTFCGGANDIGDVGASAASVEDRPCYDLSGRCVGRPVAGGVYVFGGRKVLVK